MSALVVTLLVAVAVVVAFGLGLVVGRRGRYTPAGSAAAGKCTCSVWSGPDPDCPQHGQCAALGHPCHCGAIGGDR